MLTKLIQNVLARYGLQIKRISSKLPVATLENVALVLEYYVQAHPGSVFVQIGACDGETSDSVNPFVKSGLLRSVLVEPVASNFRKLKKFYSDSPDVSLIQAAVAHKDGNSSIFSVKDEGRWKDNAWVSQLASFDKSFLVRHGVKEREIEQEKVECLTLQTLLERFGLPRVDVLQIDTEGFDAEVVKMALTLEYLPSVICFEFCQIIPQMKPSEVVAFYATLAQHGYSWSHDSNNTMAVHERVLKRWVRGPREH